MKKVISLDYKLIFQAEKLNGENFKEYITETVKNSEFVKTIVRDLKKKQELFIGISSSDPDLNKENFPNLARAIKRAFKSISCELDFVNLNPSFNLSKNTPVGPIDLHILKEGSTCNPQKIKTISYKDSNIIEDINTILRLDVRNNFSFFFRKVSTLEDTTLPSNLDLYSILLGSKSASDKVLSLISRSVIRTKNFKSLIENNPAPILIKSGANSDTNNLLTERFRFIFIRDLIKAGIPNKVITGSKSHKKLNKNYLTLEINLAVDVDSYKTKEDLAVNILGLTEGYTSSDLIKDVKESVYNIDTVLAKDVFKSGNYVLTAELVKKILSMGVKPFYEEILLDPKSDLLPLLTKSRSIAKKDKFFESNLKNLVSYL